jgi:hypothetical protein
LPVLFAQATKPANNAAHKISAIILICFMDLPPCLKRLKKLYHFYDLYVIIKIS